MNAFQAAKRIAPMLLALLLLLPAAAPAASGEGWLGVTLQPISSSMAKALSLDPDQGVLVNEVLDDSPAEKAGIEDGDVVLEFDGRPIGGHKDLNSAVRKAAPGDRVQIVVLRDGKKQRLDVELGEREGRGVIYKAFGKDGLDKLKGFKWEDGEDGTTIITNDDDTTPLMIERMHGDPDRGFLGVHLDDLNAQLGDYFGVADGRGALVTEIVDDSPAAAAGLKAGDVIVKVDEREIGSAAELHEALAETRPGDEVKIQAVRRGDREKFKITLGEVPEQEIGGKVMYFGNDDGSYTIRAPKMMWHGSPDGAHKMIQRFHTPEGEDEIVIQNGKQEMQQLHEELRKMQKELQELKKELHK